MSEHGQALATKGGGPSLPAQQAAPCPYLVAVKAASGWPLRASTRASIAAMVCLRRCLCAAGMWSRRLPVWRARGLCLGQRADAFSSHPGWKGLAGPESRRRVAPRPLRQLRRRKAPTSTPASAAPCGLPPSPGSRRAHGVAARLSAKTASTGSIPDCSSEDRATGLRRRWGPRRGGLGHPGSATDSGFATGGGLRAVTRRRGRGAGCRFLRAAPGPASRREWAPAGCCRGGWRPRRPIPAGCRARRRPATISSRIWLCRRGWGLCRARLRGLRAAASTDTSAVSKPMMRS